MCKKITFLQRIWSVSHKIQGLAKFEFTSTGGGGNGWYSKYFTVDVRQLQISPIKCFNTITNSYETIYNKLKKNKLLKFPLCLHKHCTTTNNVP